MIGKNDILEKIKAENEGRDPYEAEIDKLSWRISAIAAWVVATVLFAMEWLIDGSYNFGLFCVILLAFFVKCLVSAIKKRTVFDAVCSLILGILFFVMLGVYSIAFYNGWL